MRRMARIVLVVSLITAATIAGGPSVAFAATEDAAATDPGLATTEIAVLALVIVLAFGMLIAGARSPLVGGADLNDDARRPAGGRSRVARTSRSSSAR